MSQSSLQYCHDDMVMQVFKFVVIADQNKGDCSALKIIGKYNLQVDSEKISLIEHDTGDLVALWHYHRLRSYGYSTSKMTLEVGKKSTTGEGRFSFLTSDGQKIIKIIETCKTRLTKPKPSNSQGNGFEDLSTGKPIDFCPSTASNPPAVQKSKALPPRNSGGTAASRRPAQALPSNNASNFEVESPSRPNSNSVKSLKSAPSLASISSSSGLSKKDLKKQQKEAEKEAKKQDKKEAKENKAREKDKRKAMKEREKKERKEKKGKKNTSSAEISQSSSQEYSHAEEDLYAQANDDFVASNNSTRNKLDNDYTCVDDTVPQRTMSAIISNECQYADPWTDRILCPVAGPLQASAPPIASQEGDVYASCQKRSTVKKKQPAMVESYEEYDLQDEDTPEIPKRPGDNDESSNNDVYDHFQEPDVVPKSTENIYGMESASAPLSSVMKMDSTHSRNPPRQDQDTDIYETI